MASTQWLFHPLFPLKSNLGMMVFVEGGKPGYPDKNPRSGDENQQQTPPTYGVNIGNPEPGPHWWKASALTNCAIPVTLYLKALFFFLV